MTMTTMLPVRPTVTTTAESMFDEITSYIEYPSKELPTPERPQQHKVKWLKVTDGLWTAQNDGEYAGMVEQLDKHHYSVMSHCAEDLGVFDSLSQAKKVINDMFTVEEEPQEETPTPDMAFSYMEDYDFDFEDYADELEPLAA